MTTQRPIDLLEPLGLTVLHGVELPVPRDVEGFLEAEYPTMSQMRLPKNGLGPIVQKGAGDWDIREHSQRHRSRNAQLRSEMRADTYRMEALEKEWDDLNTIGNLNEKERARENAALVSGSVNAIVTPESVFVGMYVEPSYKSDKSDKEGVVVGFRYPNGTVMGSMNTKSSNGTVSVTWAGDHFGDTNFAQTYCMGYQDRYDLRWVKDSRRPKDSSVAAPPQAPKSPSVSGRAAPSIACVTAFNFVKDVPYTSLDLLADPVYTAVPGAVNNLKAATGYCNGVCKAHATLCTGFFVQKMASGFEICGLYSKPINIDHAVLIKSARWGALCIDLLRTKVAGI